MYALKNYTLARPRKSIVGGGQLPNYACLVSCGKKEDHALVEKSEKKKTGRVILAALYALCGVVCMRSVSDITGLSCRPLVESEFLET